MTRYIEQYNETTDPVPGDYLWIVDASAPADDKDRKLDVSRVARTGAANTFTGNQVVQDAALYGRFQTNDALAFVGLNNGAVTITVNNGQTMTVTMESGAIVALVLINVNGRAGLFVMGQVGASMGVIQDGEGFFEQTATPSSGKIGVWKSANSNTVGIKNNYGAARNISVFCIGARITNYGAPA